MNNKIYEYIMHLILLSIIILTLLSANAKIADNRILKEKSMIRDIAFAHDLALSSPNELNLDLEIDESYALSIDDACKIELKKEGENPTVYFCGKDQITRKSMQINKNEIRWHQIG